MAGRPREMVSADAMGPASPAPRQSNLDDQSGSTDDPRCLSRLSLPAVRRQTSGARAKAPKRGWLQDWRSWGNLPETDGAKRELSIRSMHRLIPSYGVCALHAAAEESSSYSSLWNRSLQAEWTTLLADETNDGGSRSNRFLLLDP